MLIRDSKVLIRQHKKTNNNKILSLNKQKQEDEQQEVLKFEKTNVWGEQKHKHGEDLWIP